MMASRDSQDQKLHELSWQGASDHKYLRELRQAQLCAEASKEPALYATDVLDPMSLNFVYLFTCLFGWFFKTGLHCVTALVSWN